MTTAQTNLRQEFDRIAKDLGATEREADTALRDAITRGGRIVRTRATRAIHTEMRVARGRQASVRRRLRLYRKRYANHRYRASVWLGGIGIGAEVFYTRSQARSAYNRQRNNRRGQSGHVNFPGPGGSVIHDSFWMDRYGRNDPIAFKRIGRGRGRIDRAHIPFIQQAGPHLIQQGNGIELIVLAEFERRLRVLTSARSR